MAVRNSLKVGRVMELNGDEDPLNNREQGDLLMKT
jgi:hypothetical protein